METAQAVKLHDDLLAGMPDGARHDTDICPFCVDNAQTTTSRIPPGDAGPDVSENKSTSTEGGTNPTMSDISQEAHEALLQKAVADAVKATESALASKTDELAAAKSKVEELETEKSTLNAETDRLNKELDTAQVKLTSATEEVETLKKEKTETEEKAKLAEVASKRSDQVKNLKLFPDEYVTEKASKWAGLTDEAWGEQLEEWKAIRPAAPEGDETKTDAASAMSGTSENLTKEEKQDAASQTKVGSARRAALSLAN